MKKRCIIFTAEAKTGVPYILPDDIGITEDDFLICADGGYICAKTAGFKPHAIIGDFDSLHRTEDIKTAESAGAEIIRLDSEKDETDTLACAKYAIGKECEDFIILGGLSGRLDHTIANIQTLSFLKDMGCTALIADDVNRATMVDGIKKSLSDLFAEYEGMRPDALGEDFEESEIYEGHKAQGVPLLLAPREGCKFGVLAYEERCVGVNIRNAKYTLTDAVLTHSYPIGVSNEFLPGTPAEISLKAGRLLVIVARDPQVAP